MPADEEKSKEKLIVELQELRARNQRLENELLNRAAEKEEGGTKQAERLKPDAAQQDTRLEESVRGNKKQLRDFFDFAPVGIFQSTPEGRYLKINHRFAEMLGYELNELLELRDIASLYLDPAQREELKRLLITNDILEDYHIHLRRKDGLDMWMSIYVKTRRDENGEVLYFDGFTLDVTRRKQAEEALRTNEEHLKAILQATPDPLVVYDHQGHPQYINPAFSKVFGWSFEELAGRSIPFVPEEEKEKTLARIREIYRTGEQVIFDTKRLTKDNRILDIRINAAIIKTSIARHYGLVVNLADVTERKQQAREKKTLQYQLHQAQKMESVGRLAGGVAHDLNNMLVIILGYGEILLNDPQLGEVQKKSVRLMNQAGQSSKNMVSKLLAFSRKQTLQVENLDLNQLLLDFKQLLHKTIKENVKMELSLTKEDIYVEGDRSQLEQSILNLVINAQDAMPEGGMLSIETGIKRLTEGSCQRYPDLNAGDYVLLKVTDTGEGMDAQTRENIFEPFFTTKEGSMGTGLGLSTVYGIIKQHQGDIRVQSEKGKGSSFKVYLPMAEKRQQGLQSQDVYLAEGSKKSETVLVIEDNELVRELTVNVLQEEGYNVLSAADGYDCLHMLDAYTGPLDLMLTDVIMPDMNGKMLYEQVVTSFPGLKIIFMSGYAEDIIVHQGILDNEVNFIQKPFNLKELKSRLRQVLDS